MSVGGKESTTAANVASCSEPQNLFSQSIQQRPANLKAMKSSHLDTENSTTNNTYPQAEDDIKNYEEGLEETRELMKKITKEKHAMSLTLKRMLKEHEEELRDKDSENQILRAELENKVVCLENLKLEVAEHKRKTIKWSSLEDKIFALEDSNAILQKRLAHSRDAMQEIEAELNELRIQKAELELGLEKQLEKQAVYHKHELELLNPKIANFELRHKKVGEFDGNVPKNTVMAPMRLRQSGKLLNRSHRRSLTAGDVVSNKMKDILKHRELENDILNQKIILLRKSRNEIKISLERHSKETAAHRLSNDDDTKAVEQEIEDGSGKDLSTAWGMQKAEVNEDGDWCDGKKNEIGDVKILQAELDSAESTMEQVSTNLRHNMKECNMLYLQAQPVEEERIPHEVMKKTIAELKEQNADLKDKVQGEAMLASAIKVLQSQLSESKSKNEEFRQKLHAQLELHSSVLDKMTNKLKDTSVLESRNRELQEQLSNYCRQEPSHIKPENHLEVHNTIAVNNQPPKNEVSHPNGSIMESFKKICGEDSDSKIGELLDTVSLLNKKVVEQQELIEMLQAASNESKLHLPVNIGLNSYNGCLSLHICLSECTFNISPVSEITPSPVIKDKPEKQRDETHKNMVSAKLQGLMTIEINRMREEVKVKSEKLQIKRQEVKDLRRKLKALHEEKNQKIGYMEDLIREREMELTHMRERSDLQIQNLREELVMKGNTIELERAETDGFRWKVLELERNEPVDISERVARLEDEVAQLSQDLVISRDAAMTACISKVQTVELLAAEIERLRNNPGIFVSLNRKTTAALPVYSRH